MSAIGTIGAFGLARQSVKGTANTSFSWMPATSVGLNSNQQVQATPLEIGGDYIQRQSYKGGVSAGGDVGFIVRPDSFGNLLYALAGQDSVTPVPGQSGAYQHIFTPFAAAAGAGLPWYTLLADKGKLWYEQYVDCHLSTLRLDIAKQSIVTGSSSWFGLTPSETTAPGSENMDTGPCFQTGQTTVNLTPYQSGSPISINTNYAERISLSFDQAVTTDETCVGQYTPVDSTMTRRTITVGYDLVIRDTALRRAIYQNGASTNWSSQVYRGGLSLVLGSNTNIAATTQPYQLTIALPGIDFMLLPTSIQAGEVMRASLSAQVTLGTANDKFTFTLINATASY